MEKIAETEQWLLNGDCSKCRRKSYCKTVCTKSQRRRDAHMRALVEGAFNEITGGAYEMIMNKATDFM